MFAYAIMAAEWEQQEENTCYLLFKSIFSS